MHSRISLFTLVVASAAAFTACKKTEVIPEARYHHTHTFSTVLGVTPAERDYLDHPTERLSGAATLNGAKLEVTVQAAGQEQLTFSVAREELLGGLVGQYRLADPTGPAGPGHVLYKYTHAGSTGPQERLYHNNSGAAYPTSGYFHIGAYDAKRGLISGQYYVSFSFAPNPKGDVTTGLGDRQIELNGSFENVKLNQ